MAGSVTTLLELVMEVVNQDTKGRSVTRVITPDISLFTLICF